MIRLDDIFSLSDFQRRTKEHVRRLRATGRPTVLTVNGRPELVVLDAESYQGILDALEQPAGLVSGKTGGVPDLELEPDPVIEEYKLHVDRTLLRENLRRPVEERVAGLIALAELADEARRAGDRVR
ncbi:MAG: type II toxin-antitoxin system Phd/YefM family antitoxin [Gemmatimonadetes bacterium]|nr:type II toxin-antitoxin system Phd/YefM family antitoxin [Gemmatimonadota bacterium]